MENPLQLEKQLECQFTVPRPFDNFEPYSNSKSYSSKCPHDKELKKIKTHHKTLSCLEENHNKEKIKDNNGILFKNKDPATL